MLNVYGLFMTSLGLELGLNKLTENGFGMDRLNVVVLDPQHPARQSLLDSMNYSDGTSLIDGIALAASIGMLLGVIFGSESYFGPVALGLAGALTGGLLGFVADFAIRKKRKGGRQAMGEVLLAVACRNSEEAANAEKIMKENGALALGRFPG